MGSFWRRLFMSRFRSALAALLFVLIFASAARANVIAPALWFWPGILPLTMLLALPASVLAAVVERPFFKRAGVSQQTIWYSLQANFISLLIGYATLPIPLFFAFWPPYEYLVFWSPIAVLLSYFSERAYLSFVNQGRFRPLRGVWIIAGNCVSSLLLALIPICADELNRRKPLLAWDLALSHGLLIGLAAAVSLAAFLIAFVVPAKPEKDAGGTDAASHNEYKM